LMNNWDRMSREVIDFHCSMVTMYQQHARHLASIAASGSFSIQSIHCFCHTSLCILGVRLLSMMKTDGVTWFIEDLAVGGRIFIH